MVSPPNERSPARWLAAGLIACLPAPALAGTPPAGDLAPCAAIDAADERLACYDQLAGRAPDTTPAASAPAAVGTVADETRPDDTTADPTNADEHSVLSRFWELDPEDKRGIFNFVGYQPNYIMPLHVTSRINRNPHSPTQASVTSPGYQRHEAKFQVSLRSKLAQNIGLPGADLWAAFTMQAVWQVFDTRESRPFRNSDYQPELIYVIPTPLRLRAAPYGWRWRYTQLGLAHQSNGQSDPLSRSWNRVYAGVGLERGPWLFTARFNQRLHEARQQDNNPDLVDYRGRLDFLLGWTNGPQAATLLYRTSPGNGHGAVQLDWSWPISRAQPKGLRWYIQLFNGYAETLTDYNFRQTTLGAGVSFLQF